MSAFDKSPSNEDREVGQGVQGDFQWERGQDAGNGRTGGLEAPEAQQ